VPERDRDQSVEQLLRRTLAATPSRSARDGCVEAETLAAWSVGGLGSDEAATVERHLADCGRCQALMATFLRAAPPAAVSEPWWRQWGIAWLVPAATAVTALALWFAIPGRGPLPLQPEPSADSIAKLEAPADSAPSSQLPAANEAADQRAAAPEPSARPAELQKKAAAPAEAENRLADFAPVPSEPAPAPPPAAPAPPLAAATAERDASLERRENAGAAASALPAPARQAARSRAFAPNEIVAPDSTSRWRILPDRVDWSTSAGAQWQPASLDSSAALTAGVAPSPTVCWLVGRAGSVYLATDGRRFTRLPFPESIDLIEVRATDARTATVTSADGRSWRTSDQGSSWTPLGR